MKPEYVLPADIEKTSMEIIADELNMRGITVPEENYGVMRRVIHATADFEYAENLVFSEDAVPRGIEALLTGAAVVTDTNMAKAGVSKVGLRKLGGEVFCYMAEPAVAERAKEEGTTRAAASVRYAAEMNPGAIFAVGNAPTALLELEAQMERGFRPALVIGVPVGFVNVVEAKERILMCCERFGVPAIVARGRKGGSSVAAAIANALIYSAADMLEPEKRGWG
jgi:precorrin-8X/cobalt-precorrin-8 methylmutase